MNWEKEKYSGDGAIQIPSSWLDVYYYEALNILFRIENALRLFVYIILKNELREKWQEVNVTSDDELNAGTIKTIAVRRIAQGKDHGYLGYFNTCPIMYLTSGELIGVIMSDAYWKYFAEHFPGKKDIMKTKLAEISMIRNALAHFRPLRDDDVSVLKQNSKHVLTNIEKCLSEVMNINDTVPTNTSDTWYEELKTTGTEYCSLSFKQSNDEKWIKIDIDYKCPNSRIRRSDRHAKYRVVNVISSSILKKYDEISRSVISLSEHVYLPVIRFYEDPSAATTSVPKELSFSKVLSLVFSRKTLTENCNKLKLEIDELLSKIKEETELIKEDHLARGQFIEAESISCSRKDANDAWHYWERENILSCAVSENDPPEYWGNFRPVTNNLISDLDKYPWMPIQVSAWSEIPF